MRYVKKTDKYTVRRKWGDILPPAYWNAPQLYIDCDKNGIVNWDSGNTSVHTEIPKNRKLVETKKGGYRQNSGRKSSTPKQPITIYVENTLIEKLGGKDKVRELIYKNLAKYKENENNQ